MNEVTKTSNIQESLAAVQSQVEASAQKAGREPTSVQLLAVSKKKPLALIEAAWQAGQRAFGENYVDEGLGKIQAFRSSHPDWPDVSTFFMRLGPHYKGWCSYVLLL